MGAISSIGIVLSAPPSAARTVETRRLLIHRRRLLASHHQSLDPSRPSARRGAYASGASAPRRAGIGATARAFPDTRSGVFIFADQLPTQLSPAQWRFVASHYVGTQKMPRDWTRAIRRLNPDFIVIHYQLAVGTGPATFMDGNRWTNDFSRVNRHEDWFVHNSRGQRLHQTTWDWDVMDIRFHRAKPRTGFPNYWLSTAVQRMRDNEDDGCFADSYTQDILFGGLRPTSLLFTDPAVCKRDWLPQLNLYGKYCVDGFHRQPERFYYIPNMGGLVTTWDNVTDYAVGDGAMNEGFCAGSPTHFNTLDDWKLEMTRVLTLARLGKIVLAQTGTDPANVDERWFVVGSYLLTKGPRSYLNLIYRSSLEWYPEYRVALGGYRDTPAIDVSDYWKPDWGVYRRDFEHGFVLVNPSANAVTVPDLGGRWNLAHTRGGGSVGSDAHDPGHLWTETVTSVTIPPHSARVLLGV